MPNHVTSRCTVNGRAEDVDAFRQRMIVTVEEDGEAPKLAFDFNRIIAMPECADAVEDDTTSPLVLVILLESLLRVQAWEDLRRFDRDGHLGPWKGTANYERGEIEERLERFSPGCIARARAMALCLGETGHKSWHGWSIAHWGTKWIAYDFNLVAESANSDGMKRLQFTFDTAWSFPAPVFRARAAEYPRLEFDCVCFDEGGRFAGQGAFNPYDGAMPFAFCKPTDQLYAQVFGCLPRRDEDDDQD